MARGTLDFDDALEAAVTAMAEADAQAKLIILEMADHLDIHFGFAQDLNDMNIRGAQIAWCFDNYCHANRHSFKACIDVRDQGMVDACNTANPSPGETAVTSGGAP